MAKAIKAAIVATFIVVTGGAFAVYMGAGGITAGGLMGAFSIAFGKYAAFTFATTLVASVIGGMTSKGIDASSANFGNKFSARGGLVPRQIVYGQCRVGGTQVHIETTGTDNYLLHMVVVLSGHEIESLETVRLNDINTTTTTSTINGSTVYTVTNADFTNTENDNNFGSGRLVRYSFEDGSQTAVNGFMNAQLASMGTTDKFLGCAYVYIQMVFDAEKFGGGMPAVSFEVKGKNVYDPRTSANATTDLQRSNPALIIRDYLTDTQYGLKAKASEINDTTNAGGIASAANTCDQNVTLADGVTTETRYTANGFTNFSANGNGVLEALLSSMAGKMSYVNGQFTLFAGASQTPSLTITDNELLAPISVSTNSSSGDLYNSVKPIYVDRSLDYQSTDAEVYQDSTFLNADTPSGESTANYVKQMETQLPFTVTDTMAQRIGRIALKSQRQTTSLSVLVSLQFMRCQPNDWVYLTNGRLGYTQKTFEVLSTNMEVIENDDVPVIATRLELKEVEASVFNFATNDYTTGQAEGSDVSTGTYSVTAPSNLALSQQNAIDGTTSKVDIRVSWTNNASDKVTLTEITYKLSTDASYTSDFTVGKRVSTGLIPNVVVGSVYNVKIRHIDVNGVTSPYTSVVNITIGVASSAPATPTSLTVTTGRLNMLVSWTNPNSSDFRAVKVYRKTANSTPTDDSDLVDTISGEPNKISTTLFGDQDGLTAGTTYYFWVRAVNHSDQHSAFSSSVAGNFIKAVPDGTIDTLQLADDAVTNAKIAVAAVQGDIIAAGAITETKLGVDAVTTAKIADNAITTALINDDAITTDKIVDDAVTNALIATDAVNQDSIAANSVTATQIVSGTITANEIATNAITSVKIDANAVTTNKINANAITTAKINAGAVTATEIATGTITANELAANSVTADQIQANAVTAAKILANTITASQIASGTITATQIAAGTITADELAADSVTASKITVSTLAAITGNLGTLTAGTIDASQVTVSNLNATNISTGTLNAQRINLNGSTLTADANGLQISTGGVDTTQIATNAVTNDKVNSISATKITADQLDSARINVDTLNVKHFADVSADIFNQTSSTVPLAVYNSANQYDGSYPGDQQNSTETTFLPITVGNVRNGATYQVLYSAVLGDTRQGKIQYSFNSNFSSATTLSPVVSSDAGTFRTYVFMWQGTITGMSSSQETVYWRINWIGGTHNSTYQSMYVYIDNTT